jgi:hypothetical protein
MTDAATGSTNGGLTLTQASYGGDGGDSEKTKAAGGAAGRGGTATSNLGLANAGASDLYAEIAAFAGSGGDNIGSYGGPAGNGGSASAELSIIDDTATSVYASTIAFGGDGGSGDLYQFLGTGTNGNGGSAIATTDLTTLTATYSDVRASAFGGNTGSYPADNGPGQTGDATARATLTLDGTVDDRRAYASARAYGGYTSFLLETPGAADAHAEIIGGLLGTATGLASADSSSGGPAGAVFAEADAPVGGPASATTHTSIGTGVTPGDYAITAGNMLSTAILAPVGAAFDDAQTYGYGAFATGYGGEGEVLEYTGSSYFDFDPLDGSELYFDFLTSTDSWGGFESLSLTITNNLDTFDYLFNSLADFGALFASDILLSGFATDPVALEVSYVFRSTTPGQGFGFDYRLASAVTPPPAPIPVPAALPLLASALAALGLLLRRRRRLAA